MSDDLDLVGSIRLDTSGLDAALGNVRSSLGTLGKIAAGVFAADKIKDFATATVGAAASFQAEISGIKAVSGATEDQLNKVRDAALRLGAETAFSATEAASAFQELIKAGISVDDALNGAADATVNLAAAGGTDLVTAATIASNALNQFGLAGKDAAHVADQIAGAANASAIDVDQYGLSLAQVGAVARTVGLSFEDTTTAIAALGQAGIVGSDAGTSLKTMLTNLVPSSKQAAAAFKELGLTTADGKNQFFDAEGKVKSLAQVSQVLQDALKGQTEEQKLANLQTLFGSDAIRAASVFAREGAAGVDEFSAAIGKISASDVAATRLDNFNGAIENLKGSVETFLITIGTPLLGPLEAAARGVSAFVGKATTELPILAVQLGSIVKQIQNGDLAGAGVSIGSLLGFDEDSGAVDRIIDALEGLSDFIRDDFTPVFEDVTDFVRNNTTAVLAGLATAVAILAGPAVFGALSAAVAFFGSILAIATSPIVLIALAIGTLVAGVIYAYQHFETFRNVVDTVVAYVIEQFGHLVEFGREVFPQLQEAVTHVFNVIVDVISIAVAVAIFLWSKFGDDLVRIGSAAFAIVRGVIEFAINNIANVIRFVLAVINGDWDKAFQALTNIASGALDLLHTIFKAIFTEALPAVIHLAIDLVKFQVGLIIEIIKAPFTSDVLQDAAKKLIDGLIQGLKNNAGRVKESLGQLTEQIKGWKGPEEVDKKLLTPAGELIVASLIPGFRAAMPAVRRELELITGNIGLVGVAATAAAGGSSSPAAAAGAGSQTITIEINFNGAADEESVSRAIPRLTSAIKAAVGGN